MCRVAAVAVLAGLLGGLDLLPAAAAAPRATLMGSEVARMLKAGEPVLLADRTRIVGNLVLGPRAVRDSFVCRRCTLTGGIYASNARFERGIDLSGSTVHGEIHLESSVFSEPALFGVADSQLPEGPGERACTAVGGPDRVGASFGGKVNFAFATFKDLADFEDVEFCAGASFTSTRFRAEGRYGGAYFGAASTFRATRFDTEALFERGFFAGPADFRSATFGGVAEFRQASFLAASDAECPKTVCFTDAVFRARADFSKMTVFPPAFFEDAHFAADALFRETKFGSSVSFADTTIGGRLDLGGATLTGSARLISLSTRELSLRDVVLTPPFELQAQNLVVSDLVASLEALELVPVEENRQPLLRVLESSAKAHGDLGLANDAHFRLQELASEDDSLVRRAADFVFYKTIAGYLVRPLRPLGWLVGIVALATLLRVFGPGRRRLPARGDGKQGKALPGSESRRRLLTRRFGMATGRVVSALALTITGREEPSPLRRAELLVYAFLIACFLLALANTNPTLRDMIDAIT